MKTPLNHREILDADGNIIREGMAVISQGLQWVVGSVNPFLIRLDRAGESRILGRKRLSCVHILGWTEPLILK